MNPVIVKIPLTNISKQKIHAREQSFPKMPIMYLELIENKGKIKSSMVDQDYVASKKGSSVSSNISISSSVVDKNEINMHSIEMLGEDEEVEAAEEEEEEADTEHKDTRDCAGDKKYRNDEKRIDREEVGNEFYYSDNNDNNRDSNPNVDKIDLFNTLAEMEDEVVYENDVGNDVENDVENDIGMSDDGDNNSDMGKHSSSDESVHSIGFPLSSGSTSSLINGNAKKDSSQEPMLDQYSTLDAKQPTSPPPGDDAFHALYQQQQQSQHQSRQQQQQSQHQSRQQQQQSQQQQQQQSQNQQQRCDKSTLPPSLTELKRQENTNNGNTNTGEGDAYNAYRFNNNGNRRHRRNPLQQQRSMLFSNPNVNAHSNNNPNANGMPVMMHPNRVEEDEKRELLFKFDILRKSYPMALIPEYNIHSDYYQMQRVYDDTVKKLALDASVENYKNYLIYGFMGCEFIFGKFFGIDMQGFTQQQINDMHKYDKLLVEIGQKNYIPKDSKWPVEIRLLFTIIINAGVFIISRMIMKGTGANLIGMMSSLFTGNNNSSGSGSGTKNTPSMPNLNTNGTNSSFGAKNENSNTSTRMRGPNLDNIPDLDDY